MRRFPILATVALFVASLFGSQYMRRQFFPSSDRPELLLSMTLPQSAVLLHDGYACVLRIGPDARLIQTKVTVGQRVGERIEITGGITASERVVAAGGAFLSDGDLVRVVDDPSAPDGGEPLPGPASATVN